MYRVDLLCEAMGFTCPDPVPCAIYLPCVDVQSFLLPPPPCSGWMDVRFCICNNAQQSLP